MPTRNQFPGFATIEMVVLAMQKPTDARIAKSDDLSDWWMTSPVQRINGHVTAS